MATTADSPIFGAPRFSPSTRGLFRKPGFSQSPTVHFGRGKGNYRGGRNNYNQRSYDDNTFNDSFNLNELKEILESNFNEETLAVDDLDKVIASTLLRTKENVDAIANVANQYNVFEEIANFEKSNNLSQPSIWNGSSELDLEEELIVPRSAYKLSEIKHSEELAALRKKYDLLIDEMSLTVEVAVGKSLNTGLENKQLKAAFKSLATKHEKLKADFDAQLEEEKLELEKKFNNRLNSANLLLKVEQEKYQKAEENVKKSVEDKVKAATTEHKVKLEALQTEKEETASLLEEQMEENANLSAALNLIQDESREKEKFLLERIKETVKNNCECSICLSIFDKAVTTTCGHSFCEACIDGWTQRLGAQVTCPYCRQQCTYRSILFFDDLIVQLKEKFPSVEWTKNEVASPS